MSFFINFFAGLCITAFALLPENIFAQQQLPNVSPNEVTVPGQNSNDKLTISYIGEIKGRSYIKITLEPLREELLQSGKNKNLIQYKGACYEAANDKTYAVTATFNPEDGSWKIKCYNKYGQYVSFFQGRETSEESIEGTWKDKRQSLIFYLFKKPGN